MSKYHFITIRIICIITLAILLSTQVTWGGYEDRVLSAARQESHLRGEQAGDNEAAAVGLANAIGGQPKSLSIAECREQLLQNLRQLRALWPSLQQEFAAGLEVLRNEGVVAFR